MARYYKKFLLFVIPLLFIFISYDVRALTISSEIGFASTSLGYNDGTWHTYENANLNKTFTGMNTKELTAFNYRFRIKDYFTTDNTYNITFNIHNYYIYYNEDYTFYDNLLDITTRSLKCYFSSTGSVQTSDSCFDTHSFDLIYVNNQEVKYSITFKPKQDIWRLLVQHESTDEPIYTTYGWETLNLTAGIVDTSVPPSNPDNPSSDLADTNQKIDDINDTLTDDSPPDTESFISNLQGLVNDSPIATLILMPFTLLNRYVEGFSGNCTPINLGNLYGTDLTMSCINISSIVGTELWSIIDGLISIFMIYNIAMLFVSVFNDITSLRDTFDSLYTPQHAKHLGKHTSEVE